MNYCNDNILTTYTKMTFLNASSECASSLIRVSIVAIVTEPPASKYTSHQLYGETWLTLE